MRRYVPGQPPAPILPWIQRPPKVRGSRVREGIFSMDLDKSFKYFVTGTTQPHRRVSFLGMPKNMLGFSPCNSTKPAVFNLQVGEETLPIATHDCAITLMSSSLEPSYLYSPLLVADFNEAWSFQGALYRQVNYADMQNAELVCVEHWPRHKFGEHPGGVERKGVVLVVKGKEFYFNTHNIAYRATEGLLTKWELYRV